jgi:nitroreductase
LPTAVIDRDRVGEGPADIGRAPTACRSVHRCACAPSVRIWLAVSFERLLSERRACRHLLPDPVPAETLDRLVMAADRAPLASNVPYRHVLVVDDQATIRAIKHIHAALLSSPPALLIIATDTKLAVDRVGRVGLLSSAIDSGAAGENVWLAATALGLGTQFTMISAMAGIRAILDFPEHFRVDLVMPIGFPDPSASGRRVRRPSTPIHRNRYAEGSSSRD